MLCCNFTPLTKILETPIKQSRKPASILPVGSHPFSRSRCCVRCLGGCLGLLSGSSSRLITNAAALQYELAQRQMSHSISRYGVPCRQQSFSLLPQTPCHVLIPSRLYSCSAALLGQMIMSQAETFCRLRVFSKVWVPVIGILYGRVILSSLQAVHLICLVIT